MKNHRFSVIFFSVIFSLVSCNSATNNETEPDDSTQIVADLPSTLLNNNGNSPAVPITEDTPEKVISSVQIINTQEFNEIVCELNNPKGFQYKGKLPAIIDFYADWCGPCRAINPFLVELAAEYAGKIVIYKVNIDKCPEVADAFQVNSIPTLVYMKPKTQPTLTVGGLPKEEIQQIIDNFLLK